MVDFDRSGLKDRVEECVRYSALINGSGCDANDKSGSVKWISVGSALS